MNNCKRTISAVYSRKMASTDPEAASKAQHTSLGIVSLPAEILLDIAKYLDVQDHSRLTRTCHHMAWTLQYALFRRHSFFRPKDCTDATIIEAHSHMEYACERRRYCRLHDKFKCYRCPPVYVSEATIKAIINRAVAFGLPASVNSTIDLFEPPIIVAVEHGNLCAVNHLIVLGADLNYKRPIKEDPRTALGYALQNISANTGGVRSLHVDIALALLRAGAAPIEGWSKFDDPKLLSVVFHQLLCEVAEDRVEEDQLRALFNLLFQPLLGLENAEFNILLRERRLADYGNMVEIIQDVSTVAEPINS